MEMATKSVSGLPMLRNYTKKLASLRFHCNCRSLILPPAQEY